MSLGSLPPSTNRSLSIFGWFHAGDGVVDNKPFVALYESGGVLDEHGKYALLGGSISSG